MIPKTLCKTSHFLLNNAMFYKKQNIVQTMHLMMFMAHPYANMGVDRVQNADKFG